MTEDLEPFWALVWWGVLCWRGFLCWLLFLFHYGTIAERDLSPCSSNIQESILSMPLDCYSNNDGCYDCTWNDTFKNLAKIEQMVALLHEETLGLHLNRQKNPKPTNAKELCQLIFMGKIWDHSNILVESCKPQCFCAKDKEMQVRCRMQKFNRRCILRKVLDCFFSFKN